MHPYGCRAYVLENKIPKKLKMLPRAHIGYLVGYDSRNIYRIWIPSKKRVIRTRDVTFDHSSFWTPDDLDIGDMLKESANDVINLLEIPQIDNQELVDDEDNSDCIGINESVTGEICGQSTDNGDFSNESNHECGVGKNQETKINSRDNITGYLPSPRETPEPLPAGISDNNTNSYQSALRKGQNDVQLPTS